MTRARPFVLGVVLAILLTGCGEDEVASEPLLTDQDTVEGLLDAPPPRLDAVGLDGPRTLEEGGCLTTVEVTPAGATATGPRWLLTLTLSETPEDAAGLGALMGEESCAALIDAERRRVVTALGAVGTDAVAVSFVDPSGRRWSSADGGGGDQSDSSEA